MPKAKKFAQEVKDADFVLKKVTGKGLSEYAKMLWDLWGKETFESLIARPQLEDQDRQDINDCRLLGTDNFYSYKVFQFAVKAFRSENHPDRFCNLEEKTRQEELFKQGEQAISRICERRGWKVP